jgi:hypothetical protein
VTKTLLNETFISKYQAAMWPKGAYSYAPLKTLCPRCMIEPLGYPALSRTTRGAADAPVYVCSPCGSAEGMQDFREGGATPQSQWPVSPDWTAVHRGR